jgi:hypothetical protein
MTSKTAIGARATARRYCKSVSICDIAMSIRWVGCQFFDRSVAFWTEKRLPILTIISSLSFLAQV